MPTQTAKHKPMSGFGPLIARQYAFALAMLRQAIQHCDDSQWTTAREPWLAPARLAIHILTSTRHYCRRPGLKLKLPRWADRMGWDSIPRSDLPSREQVLTYVDEVERQACRWLGGLSDAQLLSPDGGYKWTGRVRADRALYTLRHIHHHLGQLNVELRLAGSEPAPWLLEHDLPRQYPEDALPTF